MRPILYTFRRCPYAIRARLALAVSGIDVEKIEVDLKHKPAAMLAMSPKATVPVLQLPDGKVVEESLDIMRWALSLNDPEKWLSNKDEATQRLLEINDGVFKQSLDRYKYADRYPDHSADYYRQQAEIFITQLNRRLSMHDFLLDNQPRLVDMAILPFVRQFAHVDKSWFYASPYQAVIRWLDGLLAKDLVQLVMKK